MSNSLWIAVVLVLSVATTKSARMITCDDAIIRLIACEPFLVGDTSKMPAACCAGAASLGRMVGSGPGQVKEVCACLKQAGRSMGVNAANAKLIPHLCKITLPVPMDLNVNCDSL